MSMKIITGSTGETHVTSNNDGELNQGIFGDGLVVLANGNKLAATLVDNNTITIADGDLVLQGRHALLEPGTTETITISTGTIDFNRNDLIVARYRMDSDTGYESLELAVVEGTPTSGSAADPTTTSGVIRTGATLVEAPLYRVCIRGVVITEVKPLFEARNSDILTKISSVEKAHIVNSFVVSPSMWTNSNANPDYPNKAKVATAKYSSEFIPTYIDVVPTDGSAFYSEAEIEAKAMLNQMVLFEDDGFTVYASDVPATDITFRVGGEA